MHFFSGLFFIKIILALQLLAGIAYLLDGDYRRATYWLCASGLVWSVSF